jgi:glucose-1-phosphate thymidylyltransferase
MKAIILAGGSGTRLYPLTKVGSKQLMPIYDKPMIYYPLSVLMLAGLREILIITTLAEQPRFKALLGDGSELGLEISYAHQAEPKGIAEAFLIGESFIAQDPVCLILGDNIFYGDNFPQQLQASATLTQGVTIFAYYVNHPSRYGVVELDKQRQPLNIVEKPQTPTSNWAVTGLYFYDNQVIEIAKSLTPSARGELEITDINQHYLKQQQLHVECLGRGMAWLDTGTHETLLEASHFVQVMESRQGLKIACLEEIAYRMGYISLAQLARQANYLKHSQYGQYLLHFVKQEEL